MSLPNVRIAVFALIVSLVSSWASPADAHVKKIVIDKKVSPAFNGQSFGPAGQYETLAGRAFGELDPNDPHNAIITDIKLAPRNANGRVEYIASFFLVKPIDLSKSSHLMWQDVPNRGGRITIPPASRNDGDIGLSSGWQGDNSGRTVPADDNEWLTVPVAKNSDGSPVTGLVLGRIVNASGPDSRPLIINANPVPYKPMTLDTSKAKLTTHRAETMDGKITEGPTIPSTDWAWAKCSATNPFPGTPDPNQICVKGGFDPKLLYQVVFTSQDAYVLGIGFAAFRDVASFFKYEKQDGEGAPNPVGGQVTWVISRGQSQSGNYLRAMIHLGFTQDENNRKVYDGAWPIIAGKRVTLNTRFALPDGAGKLYEAGTEGPQWWGDWPDPVRGYYIPSTQHGGGQGGFSVNPPNAPMCPGPNFGVGMFPANPVPHTETVNALRFHFRNWVMKDVPMPSSSYPTLANGSLVDPVKEAVGFPSIPGVPKTAPTGLVNSVLDYDWGPEFNYTDGSGVRTKVPPTVKRAIKMKVPRVDADGNETGGVPVVLLGAPLGTYLGWNIVSEGFHQGKLCNYAGGMIPFARTRADREAAGDPRLSLEERYKNHDGYVAAVRTAAAKAVAAGFLLQADADRLIAEAAASNVLIPSST